MIICLLLISSPPLDLPLLEPPVHLCSRFRTAHVDSRNHPDVLRRQRKARKFEEGTEKKKRFRKSLFGIGIGIGEGSANLCSEYGTPYNITEGVELRIGRRLAQLYTFFWSRLMIFWRLPVSVPAGGVYLQSISSNPEYPPPSNTDVHPVGLKPNTLSHLPFQCSKYSSSRSDVIVCKGMTCTLQLFGSLSRSSIRLSSS